jgi:gliding motility-associated-like protein
VDSLVTPVIQSPDLNGCMPLYTSFGGNALNPKYHYLWNFGDGMVSSSYSPTHNYANPGTYPVELIVTNNTGCADTVTSQVTVYPSPNSEFGMSFSPDVYYLGLSELTLKNLSSGGIQYLWEFGTGDTSNMFEPSYQYNHPGNYTITLTVTNQWGCRDISRRLLDVKLPEDLYIPNAFTPNGDASNNNFFVVTKNITQLHIDIFDRWGERIYSSDNPEFQWDGSYQGRPVQQGVYIYLLRATGIEGTNFAKEGTVTVLK